MADESLSAGYIFRQFREGLVELAKTEDPTNGVVATLELICRLYGTWSLEENAQYFLKHKFYSPEQMDAISAEVRPISLLLLRWKEEADATLAKRSRRSARS